MAPFRLSFRHIGVLFVSTLFLLVSCSAQTRLPEIGPRQDRGLVESDAINEASGLAASRRNLGVLWTHNDSGDSTRVFAIGTDGKNLGEFFLEGVSARDWEDIAVGPGPKDETSYLYVGEIGDNGAQYDTKRIYRVPEPKVDPQAAAAPQVLSNVETITFQYPDGPRDAEVLMVDPLTRDIYVVSKREESVRVYLASYPQSTTETITLEHVATLQGLTWITAGDISGDGMGILLKDYQSVFYWRRVQGRPLAEAFKNDTVHLPYILEPQGEAIAWSADGSGYYTVSEEPQEIPAHLYFYPRLDISSVREENNSGSGSENATKPDLTNED